MRDGADIGKPDIQSVRCTRAAAVHALHSQPMGRLHTAQPPYLGGSDGVFDVACAEDIAADGLGLPVS